MRCNSLSLLVLSCLHAHVCIVHITQYSHTIFTLLSSLCASVLSSAADMERETFAKFGAGLVGSVVLARYTFDLSWGWAVLNTFTFLNQVVLTLFGCNSFYLIFASWGKKVPLDTSKFEKLKRKDYDFVTVQLPIFNEKFVIENLLNCMIQLDWPVDKLEIQILDDSNDGSEVEVARLVKELQSTTKIAMHYLHRTDRAGYKAGALAVGVKECKGKFIAMFDADFLPDPDYLLKTVPTLYSNDKVGCVQARWGHSNFDYSIFTRLQAIGHDGHFVIEQYGKDIKGLFFNFNGTAGVWKKQCILDGGGWQGDTLAEDLDLSYRCQLAGWRFAFLRDVEVLAEVPLSIG